MPLHNEERYLQAALNSLLSQTLTDWELVAVDDGSDDATPLILKTAAARDRRITTVRCGRKGLVAALNAGLEQCQAPLVARMDGDDICHPRRLELQAAFLCDHPDTGLVACNFRHFPRHSLKQGMISYETWQNALTDHELIMHDLFVESPFVHPSIMTRRTVLLQLGGYQDRNWAEDYDLWLRMAAAGIRFARLPETLFCWRDHPERATRTMAEYTSSAFRSCKLHHLRHGFLKDMQEVVIAGAGVEARAWQRLLADANIRVSHWLDVDPRKIGRILHDAPVTLPGELKLAGRKMIVAIGVPGAREQFRDVSKNLGWCEGIDFVCVA
jgi:glycosyltransferase involved in cell wall biosynthesis